MDAAAITEIIRDIARGSNAPRNMSRDVAHSLFTAMLDGSVAPLQMGALLVALRIKGESMDELAGFLAACEASYSHLSVPAGTVPLVIPAYNGARQLPNLTPLLALLVSRAGVPVLVHGVLEDDNRVTTAEIFSALGVAPAHDLSEVQQQLASRRLAFVAIETLAPSIAGLLRLRQQLGVRSSGHTLVKMLQPFSSRALRLVSVTHPEYLDRMRAFFTGTVEPVLLLRGAEGEAVAHPRREPAVEYLCGETVQVWREQAQAQPQLPASRDADVTATWITEVLSGEHPVPAAIAHQAACCVRSAN